MLPLRENEKVLIAVNYIVAGFGFLFFFPFSPVSQEMARGVGFNVFLTIMGVFAAVGVGLLIYAFGPVGERARKHRGVHPIELGGIVVLLLWLIATVCCVPIILGAAAMLAN